MAAGMDTHPGEGGIRFIKRYWAHGPGAAEIGWGTPGDHTRCVRAVQEAVVRSGHAPLPDHEIHGLCTNLQKEATGSGHDPADFAGHGNRGHG